MDRASLRKQIVTCTRCPLHKLHSPVPFRGPPHPLLLVIGEAPGRWETRQHKPFVGPSGLLLGRFLARAGYDVTSEVAFINTVSCWPDRPNQTPSRAEVNVCAKNVNDQISYFMPERILLVGLTAVGAWWPNLKMDQIRGRWFTVKGVPTIATYHPAAVLRDMAPPAIHKDIAKCFLGPTLTSRDNRDYMCVQCGREAEMWVSEGRDVTRTPGGLGIGWCIKDFRGYRRKWREEETVWLSSENVT